MSDLQDLDRIMNPRSVAIVGVSTSGSEKFSNGQYFLDRTLEFGFKGNVYPINTRGGEVSGLTVYRSLRDVPEPVDYVVSCVPASRVPQLIKDCADSGVGGICLFTAGFSEAGSQEATDLEDEVVRLAQDAGIRIIGPNCMGVYSPKASLSFAAGFPRESGRVALMCQSGTNCLYLPRAGGERGVRFSKAVSYGNAGGINESDLLEYFAQDEETDIVAAYIEGVRDGRRFYHALRALAAIKPVAVLKSACTEAGVSAAASHTGSLAGSDEVWGALLEQAGAVRVHTLDELVDMMVAFQFMRPPQGRKVAVFGNGGGATVMATDDCATAGFCLPRLPEDIRRQFIDASGTGAGTMLENPIDFAPVMSGDGTYQDLLKAVLGWHEADMVLFHIPFRGVGFGVPATHSLFAPPLSSFIELSSKSSKPVSAVFHYLDGSESWQAVPALVRQCYEAGLPVFYSIPSALKAIDRLMRYYETRKSMAG